jgi:hypothetical protein
MAKLRFADVFDVYDVEHPGRATITRVLFKDGRAVDFLERAPKGLAVKQAREHVQRHPHSFPALTPAQRACASKFIAEEMHTHKYKRRQAIAIGMSRARRECK